jgi:flagellar biosynthesis/type III secretory pathway M-ring protein FliF/YscJ
MNNSSQKGNAVVIIIIILVLVGVIWFFMSKPSTDTGTQAVPQQQTSAVTPPVDNSPAGQIKSGDSSDATLDSNTKSVDQELNKLGADASAALQ